MNKLKNIRLVVFVLLILWAAFIFIMSAQPASQSSQLSGGIVSKIIYAVNSNFDDLSAEEQQSIISAVTVIVRKTAHFTEYFIFGALSFGVAVTYQKYSVGLRVLSAILFCILYAISDEIHQYFVPGRACRLKDVCIDTTGGVLAVILFAVIICRKNKYRSGELNAQEKTN